MGLRVCSDENTIESYRNNYLLAFLETLDCSELRCSLQPLSQECENLEDTDPLQGGEDCYTQERPGESSRVLWTGRGRNGDEDPRLEAAETGRY